MNIKKLLLLFFYTITVCFLSGCAKDKFSSPDGGAGSGTTISDFAIYTPNNEDMTHALLLAANADKKTAWTYSLTEGIVLPISTNQQTTLNHISCGRVGPLCVLVGHYINKLRTYPMIAVSSDRGNTWHYSVDENHNLPDLYNDKGSFYNVSCSSTGNVCVAAGDYYDGSAQYPMIAVSTNYGFTWSYTVDKMNGLPSPFSHGTFEQVKCNNTASLCVVVGHYNNGSALLPLLAVSTDKGETWTYKIQSNGGLKLSKKGINSTAFYKIDCNDTGSVCIATGQYQTNINSKSKTYPMIAVSNDNGTNWTYTVNTNKSLPHNYVKNGLFQAGATCNNLGSLCITGGTYEDDTSSKPMIAISTDKGNTWKYSIDSNKGPLPTSFSNIGTFNSVSCNDSGDDCVAVGQYKSSINGNDIPMIAISTNRGVTWKYVVDASTGLPESFDNSPSGTSSGYFTSLNCNSSKNVCIAAGSYTTNSSNAFPMLAISTDGGKNWTYSLPSSESSKNLPAP